MMQVAHIAFVLTGEETDRIAEIQDLSCSVGVIVSFVASVASVAL